MIKRPVKEYYHKALVEKQSTKKQRKHPYLEAWKRFATQHLNILTKCIENLKKKFSPKLLIVNFIQLSYGESLVSHKISRRTMHYF